jgi:hypothetical protein
MEEVVGREGGAVERQGVAVEIVSRVQLRAVFSGLAVGIGVFAICMGLAWAIGLSTFKPTADHARGLALGSIIWGAIALWISMFCGAAVAAVAGRSPDARTGVLHGLVVWGAAAGALGFAIALLFGRLLGDIVQMSGGQMAGPAVTPRMIGGLVKAAGLTAWMYWAGIAGGLLTSIAGGVIGARSETKAPKRVPVRVPPPRPTVPQPAY